MAIPEIRHSPFSAFLSLLGVILPFLLWEDTLLVYVLILSPIYLVYSSKYLAFGLCLIALFWPSITERNLLMRALMIVNSLFIISNGSRTTKYKMTPTKALNHDFVLLIWFIKNIQLGQKCHLMGHKYINSDAHKEEIIKNYFWCQCLCCSGVGPFLLSGYSYSYNCCSFYCKNVSVFTSKSLIASSISLSCVWSSSQSSGETWYPLIHSQSSI